MPDSPIIKIDFEGLTKPMTALIEKVSEAVVGYARPQQIIRVAEAEAQADRIRANARIAVTDIERRAAYRWLREEGKKQANIEEITRQALPLLGENSQPQNIEDDWITHFFDKGRLVSD